jgi:hypothetical protein
MEKVCRETCKIMKLILFNPMPFPQRGGGMYSRRVPAGLLVFGLCLLSGCNSKVKLPATHPVRGKVVFRQGGVLPGGTITFRSQVNPAVSASSRIGPDGTFELKSFIAGDEAPGAPAGLHSVIIVPPLDNKAMASLPPFPEQTVKVSEGENNLTITLDKH